MNKITMAAIGMIACSIVTGCASTSAVSKGGAYANLPDPKPDEYLIHWENEDQIVKSEAAVFSFLAFEGGDKAPWMLRDSESRNFFGTRNYSLESKARNAALYKACQQSKCDALIGAMYDVETQDLGIYKVAKCKVKGWPARITGIEKVANKAK